MRDMITEKSSNLKSVHYDETTSNLIVEFKNGSKYLYEGVPEKMFEGLINADSHGKFFIQNIRNNYKCQRIIN